MPRDYPPGITRAQVVDNMIDRWRCPPQEEHVLAYYWHHLQHNFLVEMQKRYGDSYPPYNAAGAAKVMDAFQAALRPLLPDGLRCPQCGHQLLLDIRVDDPRSRTATIDVDCPQGCRW